MFSSITVENLVMHTFVHCLSNSINLCFRASLSSSDRDVSMVLITSLKAFSAFALICAFPALRPEESSVFGRSCLLKFPSLIGLRMGS